MGVDDFLNNKASQEDEWMGALEKCEIHLTDNIKPPPAIVQVDVQTNQHTTIFTKGNISVIKGQAKARKSFAIALICGSVMGLVRKGKFTSPRRVSIAYFDTEQSSFYVQQIVKRVNAISGGMMDDFRCFALRHMKPEQRRKALEIAFNEMKADLFILDGVRDLMKDINSQEESTDIVSDLMKWTGDTGVHLTTVLHENPSADGGGKARGSIGTELMNKAETVLEVAKLKQEPSYSVIKPYMVRGIDFEPIYFTIDDNIPVVDTNYNPDMNENNGSAPF